MLNFTINDEKIELMVQKLGSFSWSPSETEDLEAIRKQFTETFNKERIDHLTKEDYFPGLGMKQGCMAYELEWGGTKKLGGIGGGAKYKYGHEADFSNIKSLIQKVISINTGNAYQADGTPSKDLENIVASSRKMGLLQLVWVSFEAVAV